MFKAGEKLAARVAAKIAAKKAARAAAKAAAKAAVSTGKAGAKAAMGPVGWALLIFDVTSLIMDIFDTGGYENIQTIDMFVLERELEKTNLNNQLKELQDELEENENLNYPRIIGPLDSLSKKLLI